MTNHRYWLMDRILEEWRPVVGFEGLFEVSSHGRVRSLDRWVANNPNGGQRLIKGRILRGSLDKAGYRSYGLVVKQIEHRRRAHVFVAEAFIGPRPDGACIRHLDDDRTNNHVTNLAYGTHAENAADAMRNGRIPLGKDRHGTKLTDEDVRAIRRSTEVQRIVAERYGLTQAYVSEIRRGAKRIYV